MAIFEDIISDVVEPITSAVSKVMMEIITLLGDAISAIITAALEALAPEIASMIDEIVSPMIEEVRVFSDIMLETFGSIAEGLFVYVASSRDVIDISERVQTYLLETLSFLTTAMGEATDKLGRSHKYITGRMSSLSERFPQINSSIISDKLSAKIQAGKTGIESFVASTKERVQSMSEMVRERTNKELSSARTSVIRDEFRGRMIGVRTLPSTVDMSDVITRTQTLADRSLAAVSNHSDKVLSTIDRTVSNQKSKIIAEVPGIPSIPGVNELLDRVGYAIIFIGILSFLISSAFIIRIIRKI